MFQESSSAVAVRIRAQRMINTAQHRTAQHMINTLCADEKLIFSSPSSLLVYMSLHSSWNPQVDFIFGVPSSCKEMIKHS